MLECVKNEIYTLLFFCFPRWDIQKTPIKTLYNTYYKSIIFLIKEACF
jgi:hypothetical protein